VLNVYHGILQDIKHKLALIPQNSLLQGQSWANREFFQARNAVALPCNEVCLKFNEAKGRVSTISTWQVRQPIYTTSVKRWKVYEKHLGPLIDALGDLAVTD
jgi:hypothetical protein